jgi:predicted AAA+ superfamily ATPase
MLSLNLPAGKSAFLWGPRKTGKTFWIREVFSKGDEKVIDLLKTDLLTEYTARPALLRERYDGRFTIIDEVQKVPALLDEVHWLIENKNASFLLCGSSARKLRRAHANMLGGRAWRFEMAPFSFMELGEEGFDLEKVMHSGLLPPHYLSPDPQQDLRSYVADYLKDEIINEAAVRNLPAFSEFLRVAAISNAELINFTNLARDAGISAKVARGYVEILEDTLLGFRLKPWTKTPKRRMTRTDKFYLFDVGVANFLARSKPMLKSREFGKSFEHFILMEIKAFQKYLEPDLELRFWRTSTGQEVDFILGDMQAAIEIKGSDRIHANDLRGLKALSQEHKVDRQIIVCLESEPRILGQVEILPWKIFIQKLFARNII